MSSASENNGRSTNPRANEGVLANLPRTRPQRASPRRAAARKSTSASASAPTADAKPKATAALKAARSAKAKGATATKTPKRRAPAKAAPRHRAVSVDASVPRQGFESEMDRATGPVQPPGGAELVSSAAEIFGELARTGISRGERLLKDALARLPL